MAIMPLKDQNPLKSIQFQYVTVGFIAACVLAFLWQLSLGDAQGRMLYGLGAIPAVVTGARELAPELIIVPAPVTLVTSMFLHGGWMHIIGNMLYLWVFGDNVEDAMGHVRFVIFYLVCGVVAALAHVAADMDSAIPTIGASGAVSGVLGAYLVLHPRAQVLVFVFRFLIHLPAFVVLGIWIGMQFLNVYLEQGGGEGGGVAWWAHIGGFIAGALLVIPMRRKGVPLLDGFAMAQAAPEAPPPPPPASFPPRTSRARRARIPDVERKPPS